MLSRPGELREFRDKCGRFATEMRESDHKPSDHYVRKASQMERPLVCAARASMVSDSGKYSGTAGVRVFL